MNVTGHEPLLQVRELDVHFPIQTAILRRTVGLVRAVNKVDLDIQDNETLGLVGESGCGKTTLARSLLRVCEPTSGYILYRRANGEVVDIGSLNRAKLREVRREMRMIFQDPFSSLNPRLPVFEIIAQPLKMNGVTHEAELEDRVAGLLLKVGLRPEHMRRFPHAFSGGQRQRIGIARALALDPRFVVCDESVSALDVSVQAQILELLRELQAERGLSYLFVSHDLAVVQHVSDRVAVMYAGRVVEIGRMEDVYAAPRHPYTEALLAASPRPDPRVRRGGHSVRLSGEVADLANLPHGCAFHPRCRYAQEVCRVEMPSLHSISGSSQQAACHFSTELELQGVSMAVAPA